MINILFSGNNKVIDGIITTLLSILKRSTLKEPLNIIVLTMDVSHLKNSYIPISDTQIEFVHKMLKSYDSRHKIKKIDVTEIYNKEFAACPNEQCYCSPYTLLRLFIDLIDDIPDKLLYLDIDIMFNRDIHLLYDIDVNDVEYAAANDHYGKYLINPRYINAGVLLFNIKKCKETGIFKKARELIKTKKLVFADQSALIRSTTKKKLLAQKYNDQKFLHKHTIIRHFSKRLFYLPYPHTANIKQWMVSKVHKVFKYYVFDDILYEYIYLKKLMEKENII